MSETGTRVFTDVDQVSFDNIFNGLVEDSRSNSYYDDMIKLLDAKGKAQDIEIRKEYADKTYLFVCIYMCFVFFLIFLACSPSTFQMSDTVLVTLLGTTTINVIGLFAIVMNYLFPKK